MTAQILSMHAGYPSDFGKSLDPLISLKTDTAATMERQDTTLESPTKEENRGRRRNREDGTGPDGDGENGAEGDDTGAGGSSRKRRRSRKGLDKKFECPHEGCGKSYSRAEHLYRHQLNRMSPLDHLETTLEVPQMLDARGLLDNGMRHGSEDTARRIAKCTEAPLLSRSSFATSLPCPRLVTVLIGAEPVRAQRPRAK